MGKACAILTHYKWLTISMRYILDKNQMQPFKAIFGHRVQKNP